MDTRNIESMKAHYDAHAKEFTSAREAEAARRASASLPLKKYHNEVKRRLIYRFAWGAPMLLDLACGRGGDLRKWGDARIQHVVGIDLSPAEVAEAAKRHGEMEEEAQRRNQHYTLHHAEFAATDALGQAVWRYGCPDPITEPHAPLPDPLPEPAFDAVTCMFAVHYFFASSTSLEKLLATVSANLKIGGYFFGTCPDAKQVDGLLNLYGESDAHAYKAPLLSIRAHYPKGRPAAFGAPYAFGIGETVTAAHEGDDGAGSHEYLVYASVFAGAARQFGLVPVRQYGDPAYLDKLLWEPKPKDHTGLFHHFKPNFQNVDESLEIASAMNVAWVFQKLADGPEGLERLEPSLPTVPPLPEYLNHVEGAPRPELLAIGRKRPLGGGGDGGGTRKRPSRRA